MHAFSWSDRFDLFERIVPWGCLIALLVCAIAPIPSSIITAIIIITLGTSMWAVGEQVTPQAPTGLRPVFGLVALIASQSIIQTIWYYAGGFLDHRSDVISLALPLFAFTLWQTIRSHENDIERTPLSWHSFVEEARWTIPLLFTGETLLGILFLSVHRVATTNAINSPWPLLPSGVLAIFLLLFMIVALASYKSRFPLVTATLSGTFAFGVSSITPLLYQLGFGFDGFLHRASESVLLTSGTLNPKPLYYIGQYVFVTWLSRLSGVDLGQIDRWFLPALAFLLPFFLFGREPQAKQRTSFVLLLLFLPLGILSATTPQGVAYLLGLGGLLFAWDRTRTGSEHTTTNPALLSLLLTLWALVTHPLAGLPLAAITTGLWWKSWCETRGWPTWLCAIGFIFDAIIASVSVPLAFVLNSQRSSNQIDWHLEKLWQSSTWQGVSDQLLALPVSHLALWPDWADTLGWLLRVLILVGIVIALWKQKKERLTLSFLTLGGIGLGIAGIILSQTGEFSFLIDYERGNYAERLFLLALLVLLPVVVSGWEVIWERLYLAPPFILTFWLLFLGAIVSGQVYNALPRHDAAVIGHGWSVGASDIETVRFIDRDAQNKPYTVLANQSVSAAAVSQLGFKRYVGDVFFYPIPTGGPLYQLFLDATAKPSLIPIQQASVIGGSSRVYLVVNNYWWNANQVNNDYTAIADRAWSVRNGASTIFQFNVTSTSSTR
jgi:hypothetical protein